MNTQQFLKDAAELVTHDAAVTKQASELQARAETAERESEKLRRQNSNLENTQGFLLGAMKEIAESTGMAEWNRQHPNDQKTLEDLVQWVKDHWKP